MASHTFAMQAVSDYASGLSVRPGADIRLEAAIAKLFNSEVCSQIADMTLQIRAGRGYETETSLGRRGETPWPVERIWRDQRINTIVEGTSEIMRLFIAREALDPHLRKAGALIDSKSSLSAKIRALGAAAAWYPAWYLSLWSPVRQTIPAGIPAPLPAHLRFVERAARRLARALFHSMATIGPALERRQVLLGRYVDIGCDLLAMAAAVSRAASRMKSDPSDGSPAELADHFCRVARRRIEASFRAAADNDDRMSARIARSVLEDRYRWLEEGILPAGPTGTTSANGSASDAQQAPEPVASS
jgi:hypothetical protein